MSLGSAGIPHPGAFSFRGATVRRLNLSFPHRRHGEEGPPQCAAVSALAAGQTAPLPPSGNRSSGGAQRGSKRSVSDS